MILLTGWLAFICLKMTAVEIYDSPTLAQKSRCLLNNRIMHTTFNKPTSIIANLFSLNSKKSFFNGFNPSSIIILTTPKQAASTVFKIIVWLIILYYALFPNGISLTLRNRIAPFKIIKILFQSKSYWQKIPRNSLVISFLNA